MDRFERMDAIGIVLEGRDPWMQWAFEAASRITSAQTRRRPTKICVDADEVVPWLATQRLHRGPDDVFRPALRAAIEHVRAQLAPFW